MLIRLSIRDIVLIERLDIEFAGGLAVLTGETGAGKSILLDAFALALGARGDAGLVRHGVEQGQVTAAFELDEGHPARGILTENGIAIEDPLLLRRVQLADGRTRAFVNDQPVSVQVLKSLGSSLVEIHGQHDERALVDAASHRRLLDAYGRLEPQSDVLAAAWKIRRAAGEDLAAHRARVEETRREAEFLRHAVEELRALAPEAGEEASLALLRDPKAAKARRGNAAYQVAWLKRVERPVDLTCLDLGAALVLHLPGEPFVEYQLAAQDLWPDAFVCVAGYGDGGPGYIPTDQAYLEGGYEPSVALAAPCEAALTAKIAALLKARK